MYNLFKLYLSADKEFVKKQIPDVADENILCEPSRKNTAPCIAYIAYKLQQKNPKGTLVCAPADHLITDSIGFTKVCVEALDFVNKHKALITLGVTPTYPNTGYGYIQYEQQAASDNVYKVKTFTEKPNTELAKTFIASGDFLWNAGIFVWQVQNIIKAFEKYLPEMAEVFAAEKNFFNTDKETEALERIYPQCTNIKTNTWF